jgi:PadR family transcriptional regulator PadR
MEFLKDVGREQYGFGLIKETRVKAGSLYPILHRLKTLGWIVEFDEVIDEHVEGRPKRRLYRLTETGAMEATVAVVDFYADLGVEPPALFPQRPRARVR